MAGYRIVRDAETTTVLLPSPRDKTQILVVLGLMFAFGIATTLMATGHAVDRGTREPATLPWVLLFGIVGVGIPFAALLWQLFGRERITIDPAGITLRWSGLGLGYSRHYPALAVGRLRPIISANFALAFDCLGQPVQFGQGLDEADAARLVEDLRSIHPSLVMEKPS